MTGLSALSSLGLPGLNIAPPAKPITDAAVTKPIPFTELEKLSPGILPLTTSRTETGAGAFGGVLSDLVNQVNAKQVAAGEGVHQLLSGQNVPLHQVMLGVEEAGVSFQLLVEVRNKLLESYQELMRMQI